MKMVRQGIIYGIVGLLAILVLVFFAASGNRNAQEESAVSPTAEVSAEAQAGAPSKIPDIELKDYSGQAVRLKDFTGTPLVLNAWAAWCPFCLDELPDFVKAQKEFSEAVVIVAINRQELLSVAKKFSDKVGVSTEDLVLLLDPGDSFYRAIGGFSMPETLFINAAGEIVHHKRGPMRIEEIREKIRDIL